MFISNMRLADFDSAAVLGLLLKNQELRRAATDCEL